MVRDDLDVLLTSTAAELGIAEDARPEAERWLAWLRSWYGTCRLRDGRRIELPKPKRAARA